MVTAYHPCLRTKNHGCFVSIFDIWDRTHTSENGMNGTLVLVRPRTGVKHGFVHRFKRDGLDTDRFAVDYNRTANEMVTSQSKHFTPDLTVLP